MATFLKGIISYLELFARLNVNDIAFQIASLDAHKRFVIRLNTEGEPTSQLYELGEDSLGASLGDYSPNTIEGTASYLGKKAKGQRTDHITLKDTGDFYKSFVVTPYKGGVRIEADPLKDDTNLFDEFGKEIVGLSKENTELLADFYLVEIKKY